MSQIGPNNSKFARNGETKKMIPSGPQKMPYDVISGVKNPKNEFFGPNLAIFKPISMKLGKAIKNGKTQILVNFDIFGPPL